MILLDTCTFLWLVSGSKQLSSNVKKTLLQSPEGLFLSSISGFEIGVKARKGQLKLPFGIQEWFRESLEYHGVHEIPVDSEIAIRSTELPPLHNDPCDRIIIVTSQIHDLTLLTPDPLIRQYSGVKIVW